LYNRTMCTLIVCSGIWEKVPLWVAANRDEVMDRPARGPEWRNWGEVQAFSPLDVQAGGTWLGFNPQGVFAAITNRFGASGARDLRSRGELVPLALSGSDARSGVDAIAGIDPCTFNGFHLLVGDSRGAWIVWSDGTTLSPVELKSGIYVITERSFAAAPSGRQTHLEGRVSQWRAGPVPVLGEVRRTLAEHTESPFDSVCVHVKEWAYGTRSSTVAWLDASDGPSLWYGEGPPCEAAWSDYTPALRGEEERR